MIYSQVNLAIKHRAYEFIKYKDRNTLGTSISVSGDWYTIIDRSKNKYMSFHLELIYE